MAIETVGGMNKILNTYNSKDWTKSAEMDSVKELDFKDLMPSGSNPIDSKKSFSEILAGSITDVNDLQKEANTAIQKLVSGESKNLHETMLAVEKADIAFKTMNQVRMKVIDAYKEVMRMQV